MLLRALVCSAILTSAAGCTSTQNTRQTGEAKGWVRDIKLEPLRGEAGKPFEAQLTWRDNFIKEAEFEVTNLPPGLVFDPTSRRVVGTPKRAGFFTVNVAIRKRVSDEPGHRPHPDERWWPASFQLEIHAPLKE